MLHGCNYLYFFIIFVLLFITINHMFSGTQWLHGRIEISGYEEYSGTEYRSAGCSEEYSIIK